MKLKQPSRQRPRCIAQVLMKSVFPLQDVIDLLSAENTEGMLKSYYGQFLLDCMYVCCI